ncbi:YbjQ family protein [Neisseria sp. Ec49-e6-T10]|uniref:YbjQ family protein n=1 Tax=Neisseria sp. Ec49-e6-T10 TaxID=3140744 RepID=UPI003EB92F06
MALYIIYLFVFVGSCYLIGAFIEKKHDQSLKQREQVLKHILIFNEKRIPEECAGQPFPLVIGSVVMSSDYFQQRMAGLKSLFGGNLDTYESMLDRGRREAVLRMKAQAKRLGANAVFNVRFETSSLNENARGNKSNMACAELFVYGTACKLNHHNK